MSKSNPDYFRNSKEGYAVQDHPHITNRKTLLYRTNVEHGSWACNHVAGCAHGCKFPCYAYLMSRRFGRVMDYEEWLRPRLVENAREILKNDLQKNRRKIGYIHFSFMTDVFMYDHTRGDTNQEVKELSLDLIRMINAEGIPVRTLSKGIHPEELMRPDFSSRNEYGMTLVSLSDNFHRNFEPFTAPYVQRIQSLQRLSEAGFKTWVCMEPYPTPNLEPTAADIDSLLEEIKFIDKMVFGKINYNQKASRYRGAVDFFTEITDKVIAFCQRENIELYIKEGTHHHEKASGDIFENMQMTFDDILPRNTSPRCKTHK